MASSSEDDAPTADASDAAASDAAAGSSDPLSSSRVWTRGQEPEFARLPTFIDAVFAIALTLLVLDIHLPEMSGDPSDIGAMWDALLEVGPKLLSFAIAFAVLAGYWLANHAFIGRLQSIDSGLLARTLVYLAFVAFLPFPTSLVGEHETNPLSGVVFALALAAVSGMEAVLFAHAYRAGLLRQRLSRAGYRWLLAASLQPCAIFLVTLPLSFISPHVMFMSWLIATPVLGWMLSRRRPVS